MTWLNDQQTVSAARERAEKALSLPLGMASPLWLAFGAAASVGVTWWWMTRWTKAVNLESMTAFARATPEVTAAETALPLKVETEMAAEPAVQAAAPAVIPETPKAAEPEGVTRGALVPETAPMEIALADAFPAPKASPVKRAVSAPQPVPTTPEEPDDLTRLVGIGPKLAEALAARGVTRFEHIAAWTAKDLSEVDAELKLLGRAVRDAWVAQAKRFAAEQN